MEKYWDAIAVGLVTLVVVSIILIVRPGYTPIEIDDEAMIAPGAAAEVEAAVETEEAEVEVETEAEDTSDDEADAESDATEADDTATEEAED
ncbi:MAG: hypothetical protein AAF787_23645 [Chloroflexota bacterium]